MVALFSNAFGLPHPHSTMIVLEPSKQVKAVPMNLIKWHTPVTAPLVVAFAQHQRDKSLHANSARQSGTTPRLQDFQVYLEPS
jgi:hypothetical protein